MENRKEGLKRIEKFHLDGKAAENLDIFKLDRIIHSTVKCG